MGVERHARSTAIESYCRALKRKRIVGFNRITIWKDINAVPRDQHRCSRVRQRKTTFATTLQTVSYNVSAMLDAPLNGLPQSKGRWRISMLWTSLQKCATKCDWHLATSSAASNSTGIYCEQSWWPPELLSQVHQHQQYWRLGNSYHKTWIYMSRRTTSQRFSCLRTRIRHTYTCAELDKEQVSVMVTLKNRTGDKIDLIATTELHVVHTITQFHSTCVINYISYYRIICLYPEWTMRNKGFIRAAAGNRQIPRARVCYGLKWVDQIGI